MARGSNQTYSAEQKKQAASKGHSRTCAAFLASSSKESLPKEARGRHIPERSTMRKAQLIEALQTAS